MTIEKNGGDYFHLIGNTDGVVMSGSLMMAAGNVSANLIVSYGFQ